MHKSAQQTVVPCSPVQDFLASLPVKMKQLGGKLGSSLPYDLGVETVGDLGFTEEKLQEYYGVNTGHIAAECSSKGLCWNCKEPGHMANSCPNEGICRNCGKSGHIAKDCTATPMLPGEVKLCNNCYKSGHIAVECTNEKACNNCRKSGYLARNCTNEPVCNMCHVAGHLARQCPKSDEIIERGGLPPFRGGDALFRGGDAPFRAGGAPFRGGYSGVICRACSQVGHMSRGRMVGAFMICHNCGGRGHYECPYGRLLDWFPPRLTE